MFYSFFVTQIRGGVFVFTMMMSSHILPMGWGYRQVMSSHILHMGWGQKQVISSHILHMGVGTEAGDVFTHSSHGGGDRSRWCLPTFFTWKWGQKQVMSLHILLVGWGYKQVMSSHIFHIGVGTEAGDVFFTRGLGQKQTNVELFRLKKYVTLFFYSKYKNGWNPM